ncbi:hypothetical protein JHK86_017629 [Glycine max]|nr:hypothetical protein JHK86_017629 [Glycine max]
MNYIERLILIPLSIKPAGSTWCTNFIFFNLWNNIQLRLLKNSDKKRLPTLNED